MDVPAAANVLGTLGAVRAMNMNYLAGYADLDRFAGQYRYYLVMGSWNRKN